MSIGIIINSACVLVGGLLGSFFGRLLPEKMRESLYGLFGYCSIIIGIILLQNIISMPAVTLALILGTIIGEALRIEDQINFASLKLKLHRTAHQHGQQRQRRLYRQICRSADAVLHRQHWYFRRYRRRRQRRQHRTAHQVGDGYFCSLCVRCPYGAYDSLYRRAPVYFLQPAFLERQLYYAAHQSSDDRRFYGLRWYPGHHHRLSYLRA